MTRSAPPPAAQRFELVGVTSADLRGRSGLLNLTRACHSEFAGSRMCTSEEILNTVNPPATSRSGWVRPVLVPRSTGSITEFHSTDSNPPLLDLSDASGATGTVATLTCWAGHGGPGNFKTGLTIDPDGYFIRTVCDEQIGVACCAPASTPEYH